MAGEDQQVVWVDQRVLRGVLEKVLRVRHQVLVEGIAGGHQEGRREFTGAASASHLLPGGGDRAGIAGENRRGELADVDAQFQRVGGGDGANISLAQSPLDRAAF